MAPILGIIASSISGNLTSYESIATIAASGSTDSLTFSSIPTGYTHLQIRGIATVAYSSSDFGTVGIRLNGDTATNYSRHFIRGFRSGATNYAQSGAAASTTFAEAGLAYLINNSLYTGVNVIDILDYANTNKYKTIRGLSGAHWNTAGANQFGSGLWRNTAAITSVTVYGTNGTFGSNSTFALYGIKA
jgi:hypothetical protein